MNQQTEKRIRFDWTVNAGQIGSMILTLVAVGAMYGRFELTLKEQTDQLAKHDLQIEEMRKTENRLSETTAVLASIIEHQQHGPFRPPQ